MPLFRRRPDAEPAPPPGPTAPPASRRSTEELAAAEAHLSDFARAHTGVEAFIEPRAAVTDTTVLFVAASGEWTRRRVRSPQQAHALARALGIPAYDADVVGYPQRMRDWTRKRAEEDKRRLEGA